MTIISFALGLVVTVVLVVVIYFIGKITCRVIDKDWYYVPILEGVAIGVAVIGTTLFILFIVTIFALFFSKYFGV